VGRIAELVGQHAARSGPACRVESILSQYTKAERAEWEAALADDSVTTAQIARAFRADGRDVAASTIARHIRRECACG
jgi:hypothetical protein